ncbi:hypothetical protein FRB91_003422 [Serendipita sp. 411]|nr:hypothetical protein FRB91_003422 [Serendipita sp. 411]
MSTKKQAKSINNRVGKPNSGPQDATFNPSTKLSKSARLLQVTATPRVTRSTVKGSSGSIVLPVCDSGGSADSITSVPPNEGAHQQPDIVDEGARPSPNQETPEIHLVATEVVAPPVVLNHSRQTSSEPFNKGPVPRYSTKARDLYAYSEEEDMVSDDSFVMMMEDNDDDDETNGLGTFSRGEVVHEGIDATRETISQQNKQQNISGNGRSRSVQPSMATVKKKATAMPSKDDDPEFNIQCWIKADAAGALRPLALHNTMTYIDVKTVVAEFLKIRESSVDLVYTFSFTRKASDTRYLTNEDDWKALVNDAKTHRNKPQIKAARTQDAWSIQLRELREFVESKESGKKKSSRVPARAVTPTTNESTPSVSEEALIQHKLIDINNEIVCARHGGSYCLIPDEDMGPLIRQYSLSPTEHIRVTDIERKAWAKELMNDMATRFRPSKSLLASILKRASNGTHFRNQYHQAKRRNQAPETPSRYVYRASSVLSDESEPDPSVPLVPLGTSIPLQHPRSIKLEEWLMGLDENSNRCHPTLKYANFIAFFKDNDILTVAELATYKRQDLVDLDPILFMPGTAQRLTSWANEDSRVN